MQTLDLVSGLHNCLEFSQPLSCLYQAMQRRETFSILLKVALYSFFGARGIGTNGASALILKKNFYFDDVTKSKGF